MTTNNEIDPGAHVNAIFNIPWTNERGGPNSALAIELSDQITCEEAQEMYHFIVLVTKLRGSRR